MALLSKRPNDRGRLSLRFLLGLRFVPSDEQDEASTVAHREMPLL